LLESATPDYEVRCTSEQQIYTKRNSKLVVAEQQTENKANSLQERFEEKCLLKSGKLSEITNIITR
jgi:hypothetical protein